MFERTVVVNKLSAQGDTLTRQYEPINPKTNPKTQTKPEPEPKKLGLQTKNAPIGKGKQKGSEKPRGTQKHGKANDDQVLKLAGLSRKQIKQFKEMQQEFEAELRKGNGKRKQESNGNKKLSKKQRKQHTQDLYQEGAFADLPVSDSDQDAQSSSDSDSEEELTRPQKRKQKQITQVAPKRAQKEEQPDSKFEDRPPAKETNKWKKNKWEEQTSFEEFIDQGVILQSRRRGQHRYYLGQLFLRNPYNGKIVSEELPGDLNVNSCNLNRATHESEVYFQVVTNEYSREKEGPGQNQEGRQTVEEKESEAIQQRGDYNKRVSCRVVGIKVNGLTGKQIIGKVKKYSSGYVFEPISDKIRNLNIVKNKPDKKANFQESYYTASFVSWQASEKHPSCSLLKRFGTIGDIETECKVLLQMNNVYEAQFGQETTQYLKKFIQRMSDGEYVIPEAEYQAREDLREELIFTIDPKSARDFDDALSIKPLTDDQIDKFGLRQKSGQGPVYEVGIHIADVSYFVEEGSALDLEAQKRTTSVYLVHRVLPMLPRVLCETMCSLNPGVERLTVTVWCYLDSEANILPFQRFSRSIIKSKARYTYEIAQDIIKNQLQLGSVPEGFGVCDPKDQQSTFEAIRLMNDLAVKLRNKRLTNGSLTIQNYKKQFNLQKDNQPKGYTVEQRFQANFLVQEFMLLANTHVADYVTNHLGEATLLRRHMFPSNKKISKFKQLMKRFDLEFEMTKQTRLADELLKITNNPVLKRATKQLIQSELVYLLEAAQYFIIGDSKNEDWKHYALGYDRYTHFTSPIRRYPDILIHRQLLKVISNSAPIAEEEKLASKALIQKCNRCKLSARKVSSGCEKIFMCLYLKKHPVDCRGIVSFLTTTSITICIPEYDIKVVLKIADLRNIKEKKLESLGLNKYLRLRHQNNNSSIIFVLRESQYVSLNLSSTDTFPIDYRVKLILPHPTRVGKSVMVE